MFGTIIHTLAQLLGTGGIALFIATVDPCTRIVTANRASLAALQTLLELLVAPLALIPCAVRCDVVVAQIATVLAGIPIAFAWAIEAFAGVIVVIGHAASMHGVVVPMTGIAVTHNTPAVVKAVMVVVIYHYHTAVMPMYRAEIKAGAEVNAGAPVETGYKDIAAGVVPIHRWVVRPPPAAIHHAGIVSGYIHHSLNRGFNYNGSLFANHSHMFNFVQITRIIRAVTQVLDTVHHPLFIGEKGVTQLLGPIQVIAHAL